MIRWSRAANPKYGNISRDMWHSLFTGKDNQTHDIGRWSWGISLLSIVGSAGLMLWTRGAVDLLTLAQALGIVSAAHGAAVAVKGKTEPEPQQ